MSLIENDPILKVEEVAKEIRADVSNTKKALGGYTIFVAILFSLVIGAVFGAFVNFIFLSSKYKNHDEATPKCIKVEEKSTSTPTNVKNIEGEKSDTLISPVACTMDAKICSDGSAVGRTGPKCEFAKCPGEL